MPSRRRFNTDSKYATIDGDTDQDDFIDTHSEGDDDGIDQDDADEAEDSVDLDILLSARHAARIRGRRRILAPGVVINKALGGAQPGATLAENSTSNGVVSVGMARPPFGPRDNFRRTKSCSTSNGGGTSNLVANGNAGKSGTFAPLNGLVKEDRRFKNSRKSRSLFGRGLSKKGGAGGKGVWGALGSELAVTGAASKRRNNVDITSGTGVAREKGASSRDDPNYDSSSAEDDDNVVLVSRDTAPEEIVERIGTATREYFQHGDTNEVIVTLADWKIAPKFRHLIPYGIVRTALDGKRGECEMASQLLADMPEELVTRDKFEDGYTHLLEELVDLQLDCPEAPQIVGNFLARSVADEVISLKFLRRMKRAMHDAVVDEVAEHAAGVADNKNGTAAVRNGHANTAKSSLLNGHYHNGSITSYSDSGRGISTSSSIGSADDDVASLSMAQLSVVAHEALQRADTLLSMKHGLIKLDTIWGIGGGITPVKALSTKMSKIIMEYINSAELDEALRCIRELEVPHFHHELVYLIIQHACEANGRHSDRLLRLLKALSSDDTMIVPPAQMTRGFMRAYESMNDIVLDVPQVYTIVESIVNESVKLGIIDEAVAQACPQRGRKRFVSEGDGGLVKV